MSQMCVNRLFLILLLGSCAFVRSSLEQLDAETTDLYEAKGGQMFMDKIMNAQLDSKTQKEVMSDMSQIAHRNYGKYVSTPLKFPSVFARHDSIVADSATAHKPVLMDAGASGLENLMNRKEIRNGVQAASRFGVFQDPVPPAAPAMDSSGYASASYGSLGLH